LYLSGLKSIRRTRSGEEDRLLLVLLVPTPPLTASKSSPATPCTSLASLLRAVASAETVADEEECDADATDAWEDA
jgi:hypothetical protein